MRQLGAQTSVRVLVAEAQRRGRAVRVVPGGVDKHTSLVAFAEALDLPSWFGHNLDALTDALRDLHDPEGRDIELVWDRVAALRAGDPRSYAGILAVLGDVDADRPDLHVTVVVR
ncbi:MAG: barstar family protein [Dermatophilaceae bacterium]